MAYVSQELKAELAPKIKEVLKKYKMKGSISVQNYSTLVVKIQSGKIQYDKPQNEISIHHIESLYFGEIRQFLRELKNAMMEGNHDNSDSQTDYFDIGWYISIKMGTWNKPYIYQP